MDLQSSEAEVGFDIRIPPTENPDAIKRRIMEEWVPLSRNLTFQVSQFNSILLKHFSHFISEKNLNESPSLLQEKTWKNDSLTHSEYNEKQVDHQSRVIFLSIFPKKRRIRMK